MDKPIVLAFGRLNPPTKGHQKLVDTMVSAAKKYNAPAQLYLSHSTDKLRNPLTYDSKVYWVNKAFGNKVDVVESEARTVFEILKDLYSEGYTDVIYVGGADRIGGAEDISQTILRYNGTPNKSGEVPYNFDSIKFVNAGIRDDSSNDITERASASAARAAVVNGNFESFKELVPFNEKDADSLFRQLYQIMVGEEVPENLNEISNELDEEFLTEEIDGQVNIKGKTYTVKPNNTILMGSDRFRKDFEYIFDGTPISVNIPEKNINIEQTDDYEVVNGSKGSAGYHGKLIIYDIKRDENGNILSKDKLITLDAKMGSINGQSEGQFVESLVCYYFNNGFDSGAPKDSVGNNIEVDKAWWDSIVKSVDILTKRWSNEEYVAVQVDGIHLDNIDSNYLQIAEIFKNKWLAGKILTGDLKSFKDLYFGGKDNWSKADILLIKIGTTPQSVFGVINNSYELTEKVTYLCNKGIIIPVSLKKVSSRSSNIDYVDPSDNKIKVSGLVQIKYPTKIIPNDTNCSCYLINENNKIQFRQQVGSNGTLSIEVQYGIARGGKPLTRLKHDLGLSGNYWYNNFTINSSKELKNLLSDIVGDNIIEDKPIPENAGGTEPWYNRVCFRGLIGLYREYVSYNGETSADEFMNWIYNMATTTPTPFWIIR